MGALKLNQYSKEQIRNAEIARAVGAPPRIVILKYIKENGSANGLKLFDLLNLNQATIQQHVQVLRQTGLILGDYLGSEFRWRLNPDCETELEKIAWCLD